MPREGSAASLAPRASCLGSAAKPCGFFLHSVHRREVPSRVIDLPPAVVCSRGQAGVVMASSRGAPWDLHHMVEGAVFHVFFSERCRTWTISPAAFEMSPGIEYKEAVGTNSACLHCYQMFWKADTARDRVPLPLAAVEWRQEPHSLLRQQRKHKQGHFHSEQCPLKSHIIFTGINFILNDLVQGSHSAHNSILGVYSQDKVMVVYVILYTLGSKDNIIRWCWINSSALKSIMQVPDFKIPFALCSGCPQAASIHEDANNFRNHVLCYLSLCFRLIVHKCAVLGYSPCVGKMCTWEVWCEQMCFNLPGRWEKPLPAAQCGFALQWSVIKGMWIPLQSVLQEGDACECSRPYSPAECRLVWLMCFCSLWGGHMQKPRTQFHVCCWTFHTHCILAGNSSYYKWTRGHCCGKGHSVQQRIHM